MKDQHPQEDSEFLKDLAPVLFHEKRAIPSDPPSGYFDSFAERLMSRLPSEKKTPAKGRILHLINYRNLAIAASVAALIAFGLLLRDEEHTVITHEIVWDEAAIDAATEYIDEQELFSSLSSEELNNIAVFSDYTEEDVEYLMLEFESNDDFYID